MTDLLEQRLADALGAARDDDRWAVAPRPDALELVRRGARRRRRRTSVLATAACALAVVAVGTGVTTALPAGDDVTSYASSGRGQAHGHDWLLTVEQNSRWRPPRELPQPAVFDDAARDRLREQALAVVPGARLSTEAAPLSSGGVGILLELPTGDLVEVQRRQLSAPMVWDAGEAGTGTAAHVEDVPGTTYAVLLQPGPAAGLEVDAVGTNAVALVDRDGVVTEWVAAYPVTVERLLAWAVAAGS